MRRRPRWVPLLLLGAFAGQSLWLAATTSPTFDEPNRVGVGAYLWRTWNYDVSALIPHTPLPYHLTAIPLIFLDVPDAIWAGYRADYARDVGLPLIFDTSFGAPVVLFLSRLPVTLLGVLLGWLVYRKTARRFGVAAGHLAVGLYAFCPNLIAYSSVLTADLCGAYFIALAVFSYARYLRRRTVRRLAAAGVLAGLAVLAKYTALSLALILPALAAADLVLRRRAGSAGEASLRRRAIDAALLVGLAYVVIWAGYGFQFAPLSPAAERPHAALDAVVAPGTGPHAFLQNLLETVPIPAPMFWKGMLWLSGHAQVGHLTYLAGETSLHGRSWFYVVAYAVKTPLPALFLLASATFFWRRRRGLLFDDVELAIPVLGIVGIASFFGIQLGLRYVAAAFPFLLIHMSRVAAGPLRRSVAAGLASLVFLQAAGVLRHAPHYLAYFNEAAGGPGEGHRWLVGSDLDWGQDLPALAAEVRARGIRELSVDYFGYADPRYYLPGVRLVHLPERPASGYFAVSVSKLRLYHPREYADLLRTPPLAKIGYSIYLYRLP